MKGQSGYQILYDGRHTTVRIPTTDINGRPIMRELKFAGHAVAENNGDGWKQHLPEQEDA